MRESMNVYISNPRFTISCISYIYIYIGHRDVAELLVGAGADVNHADKYGKTALMRASEEGQRDVVELLGPQGRHKVTARRPWQEVRRSRRVL